MNKLLAFILVLLVESKFGWSQECDSTGVKCVNCSAYQKCSGGVPEGGVTSCKNGEACVDGALDQCKTKLKCYAGGECTGQGIFPDPIAEGNFYVCLGDPFNGFSKFEFSCQPGQYFDASTSACTSSAVTDPTATTSLMTSVTSEPIPSDTTSTAVSDITSTTVSDTTSTTVSDATSTTVSDATSTMVSDATSTTVSDATSTTVSDTTPSDVTPTTVSETTPSETTPTTVSDTTISGVTTTSPADSTTTSLTSTATSPLISTTTTPVPTTTPTPGTTTPTSPTAAPPLVCIIPGIFPVLTNCKLYYRCSTSLQIFYFTCPGNSYFNEMILKCSLIISPACQEQILQNQTSTTSTSSPVTTALTTTTTVSTTTSTTTAAPATTSTTTAAPTTTSTTTSPVPTTTSTTTPVSTTASSTVSTTITPVPELPTTTPPITFVCPSVGTYEDPASCKTYFRCSSSGKIFIFTCPGNSYFNEMTKKCTLILTPRCVKLLQG